MTHRQAQPVTITLPTKLLHTADKIAKQEGHTRSELFREALRALVWKRRWEVIQAYGAQKTKGMDLSDEKIDALVHEMRSDKRK
jgi:metal-responsive CopG/Arc/MetJ family transcriptional regulator